MWPATTRPNLSGQAVTNNTADTTPPALLSAAVNGASLVLTYGEALDESSRAGGGRLRRDDRQRGAPPRPHR